MTDTTHLEHPLDPPRRDAAAAWLRLGVTALAASGLFAILLVASRTPGIQDLIPWLDFFRTALVVHVDLSVLVWFLAIGGMLYSLHQRPRVHLQRVARLLAWTGMALVIAAPFSGDAHPLINNYVPVLQLPLFHIGIALFAAGIALPALATLGERPPVLDAPIALAVWTGMIGIVIALASTLWSWLGVDPQTQSTVYFEYLFWSGGHAIQFSYGQFLIAAWLWIARHSGVRNPLGERMTGILVALGALPLLWVLVIHLQHPVFSPESRVAFTALMQWGGGLATVPIGLALLVGLWRAPRAELAMLAVRRALWASILLFGAGGLIAIMIAGVNTIIPAHYHGSIVGITLAFMGLAYLLLPRLGYAAAQGRLARWQPGIYAVGQVLHIGGLAVSGAFGIQRKTAGAAQGLDGITKITMGVMGLGGLLAVIGGIMFVLAMILAMRRTRPRT